MTKTFITDKDGATVDASTVTVPSDRHFRNAWKLDGSVIAEDMKRAQVVYSAPDMVAIGKAIDEVGISAEFQEMLVKASNLGTLDRACGMVRFE